MGAHHLHPAACPESATSGMAASLFRNGLLVGQFCLSVVALLGGWIVIGDRSDGCA
jgi:hypothetical protein